MEACPVPEEHEISAAVSRIGATEPKGNVVTFRGPVVRSPTPRAGPHQSRKKPPPAQGAAALRFGELGQRPAVRVPNGTRVRGDRQLTKRAALSESLRDGRQMAPRRDLRGRRRLSGQLRREPVFAQYWPFRANFKLAWKSTGRNGSSWAGVWLPRCADLEATLRRGPDGTRWHSQGGS